MTFRDRRHAGELLAAELAAYGGPETIVLGLPRGGVIVGEAVARKLAVPLDVLISQKIGAPGNPEYAIGAVAEVGEPQLNQEVVRLYGVSSSYLAAEIERARAEIQRRVALYRGGRPLPSLTGQRAILVDDGIATGFTMLAAVRAVRGAGARETIVAVPVAAPESLHQVERQADRVVCLSAPSLFFAVGAFYQDFEQVSDDEVRRSLESVAIERQEPPA